jgi:arabinofuranosyltransferase
MKHLNFNWSCALRTRVQIYLRCWHLTVPVLLACVFSFFNLQHFFEDALIYARYINHFLEGSGLVYNVGDRFNGLTSPIFSYISILFSYLIGDIILSINLISSISLILVIILAHRLFFRFEPKVYGFFSLMLIACCQYTYSLFGMETILFVAIILFALLLYRDGKTHYLMIVLAFLFLVRSEGIFLILPIIFMHFKEGCCFPKKKYFLIPMAIVLIHYTITWQYYGGIFPETAMAKIYQGSSGLFGETPPLFITSSYYLVDWYFLDSKVLFLSLVTFAFFGVFKLGWSSLNIITVVFLCLLLSFYCIINIPNYHWYNAPFIYFMFIYSGLGLGLILDKILSVDKYRFLVALIGGMLISSALISRLELGAPDHPYSKIADWFVDNTESSASIAMVEIGIIGFFSDRTIIDILGLVNPHNAKLIGQRDYSGWLEHYDPDYIFVHDPVWVHEVSVDSAVKFGGYTEDIRFDFKGYKLYKSEKN